MSGTRMTTALGRTMRAFVSKQTHAIYQSCLPKLSVARQRQDGWTFDRRSRHVCSVAVPGTPGQETNERSTISEPQKIQLGYSFSPAGLLFPYYLGVLKALRELNLINSRTPMAGSSAGSIISSFTACDINIEDGIEANKELQRRLLANPGKKILGQALRDTMNEVLPHNAHELVNGQINIAVTRLWPLPFKGLTLENFESKDDLVEAICASCFAPFIAGRSLGMWTKHGYCLDGFVFNFFPGMPEQYKDSVNQVVQVCACPKELRTVTCKGSPDICPDLAGELRYSAREYLQMAIAEFPVPVVDDLASQGYDDGMTWANQFKQLNNGH